MRGSNYDKFPCTVVDGKIAIGWKDITNKLKEEAYPHKTVCIDLYVGTHEEEIVSAFNGFDGRKLILTKDLMKSETEVKAMTDGLLTDDVLFGHRTYLSMTDYFPKGTIEKTKSSINGSDGKWIIIGCGASLFMDDAALLVYADMARWEIQLRIRRKEIQALGLDNRLEATSVQQKRGYFNDWLICDKHKDSIIRKVDYWLDTNKKDCPKMISSETFMKGIDKTAAAPFRVVPFFDPAPWGGQWMKDVCDLDRSAPNYGWCFDCVPEENSLLLKVDGTLFEIPSQDLILLKSRDVLGEPVESRFGKDFPIRFDFLDTIRGGNLSLQVHPTTQFVKENFGLNYTQDESYYLLDCDENACVYLGLKPNVDKTEMINALEESQDKGKNFDAEKYVNKFKAKKHDHYLIPGGTIHCSGSGSMVLEISSTPNIYTFKLWDWNRMGLDGKPRPINIERGKNVIDWERDTEYVHKHLANHIEVVSEGDGRKEEKTGLHPNEFIETRRHWFTKTVTHRTDNSVNVLNLIEGEEALVESPDNEFEPFVVHYAETFIVPAVVGSYTIRPFGRSVGKKCGTIKASVRF